MGFRTHSSLFVRQPGVPARDVGTASDPSAPHQPRLNNLGRR